MFHGTWFSLDYILVECKKCYFFKKFYCHVKIYLLVDMPLLNLITGDKTSSSIVILFSAFSGLTKISSSVSSSANK